MTYRTLLVVTLLFVAGWGLGRISANDLTANIFQKEEYATIRWDGRDNTRVIRPNQRADSFRDVFSGLSKPRDTDARAFYMSAAMNILAREGYVFAGMSENSIVMKRPVKP